MTSNSCVVRRVERIAYRELEFAQSLGLSTRTLKRWARDGNAIPGRFKIGSSVFYDKILADQWLAEKAGRSQGGTNE